jgi:hypothetical protein
MNFDDIAIEKHTRQDRLKDAILACIDEFGNPLINVVHTSSVYENDIGRRKNLLDHYKSVFASGEAKRVMDAWVNKCL